MTATEFSGVAALFSQLEASMPHASLPSTPASDRRNGSNLTDTMRAYSWPLLRSIKLSRGQSWSVEGVGSQS